MLVRLCFPNYIRIRGGIRDESVFRLQLVVVQEIRTFVPAHPQAIRTQSEFEVGEFASRDDWQHPIPVGNGDGQFNEVWNFSVGCA